MIGRFAGFNIPKISQDINSNSEDYSKLAMLPSRINALKEQAEIGLMEKQYASGLKSFADGISLNNQSKLNSSGAAKERSMGLVSTIGDGISGLAGGISEKYGNPGNDIGDEFRFDTGIGYGNPYGVDLNRNYGY